MRTFIGVAALAAAMVLTGCGPSEGDQADGASKTPVASPTPTGPTYVETEECRREAGRVLDMLDLGGEAGDVSVLLDKLAAIEDLGTAPTSLCSAHVSIPVDGAVGALRCFRDQALALDVAPGCPPVGTALFVMGDHIGVARKALDATK